MKPVNFPEANCTFGPPAGYTEDQVMTIPAFRGQMFGGPVDGDQIIIVAWKPEEQEVTDIVAGKPVFLMAINGLPPHALTTNPKFQ